MDIAVGTIQLGTVALVARHPLVEAVVRQSPQIIQAEMGISQEVGGEGLAGVAARAALVHQDL